MTTIIDVRNYFKAKLATLTLPNVTYEGEKYEPKASESFVRVKLLPRETQNASMGSSGMRLLGGIARIDIFVPRKDGYDAAATYANSIVNLLKPSSEIVTGTRSIVIYSSWVEGSVEEPAFLKLPVFVRFEAFN